VDGQVVVVIGGTAGLGRSAVRMCVASGARVVAVGRSQQGCDDLQKSLGDAVETVVGDARNPAVAQQAIETAMSKFGQFNALYHVAGGSGRDFGDGPLAEITDEGWQQTIDWNITSVFYSNRAAIQQFLKQETAGAILNMTSVLAWSPAPEHFASHAYATSKAAIIGLTRAAAAKYAKHNIRINAIAPALVETSMAERALSDANIMTYVRTKQPLDGGRPASVEDLDAAVRFLLSDESRFVTGQVVTVDGGWSISDGQVR